MALFRRHGGFVPSNRSDRVMRRVRRVLEDAPSGERTRSADETFADVVRLRGLEAPWYGWTRQAQKLGIWFRSRTAMTRRSARGTIPQVVKSSPSKALSSRLFLLRRGGGPGHDAIVTTVDQSGIRVLVNALNDPTGASSLYRRASAPKHRPKGATRVPPIRTHVVDWPAAPPPRAYRTSPGTV
jgi:hypothetical protein